MQIMTKTERVLLQGRGNTLDMTRNNERQGQEVRTKLLDVQKR